VRSGTTYQSTRGPQAPPRVDDMSVQPVQYRIDRRAPATAPSHRQPTSCSVVNSCSSFRSV
jgi:hypothetical protein